MAALITQILRAVERGNIEQTFSTSDVKSWVALKSICKNDGTSYAASSIDSILANSDKKNIPTSNLNKKMLKSRIGIGFKKVYWFEDVL